MVKAWRERKATYERTLSTMSGPVSPVTDLIFAKAEINELRAELAVAQKGTEISRLRHLCEDKHASMLMFQRENEELRKKLATQES